MRKLFKLILYSFFIILFLLPITAQQPLVNADTSEELSKELSEKQAEIAKLEAQLSDAKKQEKSLKSQLDIIDSQTKITELKIDETNLKIAKLEREINDLSSRITRISSSVDTLSEVLLERIVQTYKYGSLSTVDLLFSSHGFPELLERLKYVQVAQANDKKVLYQLQATKATYNDQRQDKETRQVEAEKLTKELESYSKQLAEQRKGKDELLKVTRNDEARYQALIAQLRAELISISSALSNIGAQIGPKNKGDLVAVMGSTGCSTGPHLHYEVYEKAKVSGGKVVDKDTGTPVANNIWSYLVDPQNYINNQSFNSPLSGYPNGNMVLTTKFREWYQFFGGSYHTGLDIAPSGGGGLGTPIYAANNGIAYVTSGSCSAPPPGGSSVGKGVVIDHQDGRVTLYWHIL